MRCSLKIQCQEVSPTLERRAVLAGLATLVAVAPLASARAEAETRLSDLVTSDGEASDLARSIAGQLIRVRGYLAPSLDGVEFALSESSPGACQLCGLVHDAGPAIIIRASSAATSLPAFELVRAEGRVVVNEGISAITLADAKVQAL